MSGSLRIAIATPNAPDKIETFISQQINGLPCVLSIHGSLLKGETVPGGRVGPRLGSDVLLRMISKSGSVEGLRTTMQSAEIKRRLRAARVDVLLANFGPTAAALQPLAEEMKLPFVAHFHGFDAHTQSVVSRYRDSYRKLGQTAKAVVVVSNGMRSALVECGIPQEKIHVVRCGVIADRFPPRATPPPTAQFLAVGRFVDKKAPYLTLLAFSKVRQQLPDARLIMVGNGELLETCVNLAASLNLSDAVEFPGPLGQERIAELLRSTSAFVQHSIEPHHGPQAGDREGTPVAIMEAMVASVPVVSTRHAGIAEILSDGHSGLLVDERDVEGMARAMIRLGSSMELSARMGQNAREDALREHTSDRCLGNLLKIITQAACKSEISPVS